jgi:predicted TIM-barrel fold metal-dependent hydrolase
LPGRKAPRVAFPDEVQVMNYIDAHAHVWTPDTIHYPLGEGWKKEDMQPASFTAAELLKHAKPAGVTRINLIQMSYYCPKDLNSTKGKGFENPCPI